MSVNAGQPTIVRTYDAYNPFIASWQDQGIFDECRTCWQNYNLVLRQAAASFHIPIAAVADPWNGPSFTEDPVAKGYTRDGIHPNADGAHVIAEALRALGYEPVDPGR